MNDDERDDVQHEDLGHDEWSEELRGPDLGGMVAGLAVGVLMTLCAVLLWNQLSPDEQDRGPAALVGAVGAGTTSAGADDTASPQVGHEDHGATRLARCVRGYELLQGPLDAAQASLDQWSVHVGAMNKLVVGEITLKQATDFWNDTRVGAHQRLREFDRAVGDLRRQGVDCPDPEFLAPGNVALPSCARAVQAEARALRAAQVSIATWAEHVHHMDMLRLGQMTPEQATTMWLQSWKQGVRELDGYEVASRVTRRQDGCNGAAATR